MKFKLKREMEVATSAALEAGELLRSEFMRPDGPRGEAGHCPTDGEAKAMIRARIGAGFPADGIIGEELGLIGALAVVLAFVVLLWRGLRASWSAPDDFGRFLAAGITLSIVFQALINVSVVLGLLPTKGIPLPFISAGGSSLVFALFGVGLVANVSQHGD